MKDSFIVYNDLLDSITDLSMEQRGQLLTAMLMHSRGDNPVTLDGITGMAFQFVKTVMDRDAKKYEEKCRKNRENGELGGRPKKANATEKTERLSKNRTQAKKPDSDNDSDNDNESPSETINTHGDFQNVRLTQAELARLYADYNKRDIDDAIKYLDAYIADKGYKTKSKTHNLALRRWGIQAAIEHRARGKPNKFHNFTQRNNDYGEMQRKLIAAQRGGA